MSKAIYHDDMFNGESTRINHSYYVFKPITVTYMQIILMFFVMYTIIVNVANQWRV